MDTTLPCGREGPPDPPCFDTPPETPRKTAAQQTHKTGDMKNMQMTKSDNGGTQNRAEKRTAGRAARTRRENE